MNHLLQPFHPQDLQAIRELHVQSGSAPTVARALTQTQDTVGEEMLRRRVVRSASGLMGYSYAARSPWHPPGAFQTEVFVQPFARRQGVGSRLMADIVNWAAQQGAVALSTWASGKCPEFVRFAERREFRVVQRFVTMVLELKHADERGLEEHLEAARRRGFSLFTFADTGQTLAARVKLYDLNRRLAPSLPGNGDDFPALEDYARDIIEAPWFRADGQLIAADGEHWVGLVGLGFYDEGKRLHNEFTAVDPTYRRRGVAQALKAWSVLLARGLGAEEIRTGNDATNEAIIRLNRRLGYRLEPGAVKLERAIVK